MALRRPPVTAIEAPRRRTATRAGVSSCARSSARQATSQARSAEVPPSRADEPRTAFSRRPEARSIRSITHGRPCPCATSSARPSVRPGSRDVRRAAGRRRVPGHPRRGGIARSRPSIVPAEHPCSVRRHGQGPPLHRSNALGREGARRPAGQPLHVPTRHATGGLPEQHESRWRPAATPRLSMKIRSGFGSSLDCAAPGECSSTRGSVAGIAATQRPSDDIPKAWPRPSRTGAEAPARSRYASYPATAWSASVMALPSGATQKPVDTSRKRHIPRRVSPAIIASTRRSLTSMPSSTRPSAAMSKRRSCVGAV